MYFDNLYSGLLYSSAQLSLCKFIFSHCQIYSRGIVVSIVTATDCTPKELQFDCRKGKEFFLFSDLSSRGAPSLLFNGFRGFAPGWGVTRPKRETDHLSLYTTKIKNNWSRTSSTPYAFMACVETALPDHYQMWKSPVQSFLILNLLVSRAIIFGHFCSLSLHFSRS